MWFLNNFPLLLIVKKLNVYSPCSLMILISALKTNLVEAMEGLKRLHLLISLQDFCCSEKAPNCHQTRVLSASVKTLSKNSA